MRAGLMDRRGQLQQSSGGSWSTTRDEWARVLDHGAAVNRALARATDLERRLFGADEIPNERELIAIRYDASVDTSWRWVDEDGQAWRILGVYEGEGRKEETVLALVPFADYEDQHDDILADLLEHGAAVTFTKTSQAYNASTGESTPIVTSVAGRAVQVSGDPVAYERLSLTESDAPTLLFAADTYGEIPEVGSRCTWGGRTYTAREVLPDAPDGTAIRCRVVISA